MLRECKCLCLWLSPPRVHALVDVSSQAFVFDHWARWMLRVVHPKLKKPPRPQELSYRTGELLDVKERLLYLHRSRNKSWLKNVALQNILDAWAARRPAWCPVRRLWPKPVAIETAILAAASASLSTSRILDSGG